MINSIAIASLKWSLARLREPSTWKGLIALTSALGVAISPANAAIILAAGMGIAGFINVVITDPNKDFKAEIDSALNDVIIPVVKTVIDSKKV